MAIYMKFQGTKGDVTTKGFLGWIELNSFHWSLSRNIDPPARGAVREMSEPVCHNVIVTKRIDVSSPDLVLRACSGTHEYDVQISFTTTNRDHVTRYLHYKFEDVGMARYTVDSSGDAPIESLELSFARFMLEYVAVAPDGRDGAKPKAGYDFYQMHKI